MLFSRNISNNRARYLQPAVFNPLTGEKLRKTA